MSICPDPKPVMPFSGRHRNGFTLIELMVAISVLSLMMIFIAQLVSVVDAFARDGARRADNYTKARATLDAFSRDIRAGVFRSDLAAFANASGNTDANGDSPICFYTCRPGVGSGVRNVSLVVYQLKTATGTLQRGAMPVQWTDNANSTLVNPFPISFTNTSALPMYASVVPQDMANGVVRMEVYFINSGGSLSKTYSPQALAVGMTLAVIDNGTLQILTPAQLAQLTLTKGAGALLPDDPSSSPIQPLSSYWESKMAVPGFYSGYPTQLRSGLRIFEHYIELPGN